jgi:hypothetical protein
LRLVELAQRVVGHEVVDQDLIAFALIPVSEAKLRRPRLKMTYVNRP